MDFEAKYSDRLSIFKEVLCREGHPRPRPLAGSPEYAFNLFLYHKYSSSQNFYYTKEVGSILADSRARSNIVFNDMLTIVKCEEFLRKAYDSETIRSKLRLLAEYYKYHEDVPRLFMTNLTHTIHNYYDKKRRINYLRITNQLNIKLDERINIHDSESLEMSDRTLSSSMARLLPSELIGGSRLPTHRRNSSKSFTIADLNDALGAIFPSKLHSKTPKPQILRDPDLKKLILKKLRNENFLKKLISTQKGPSIPEVPTVPANVCRKNRSPAGVKVGSAAPRKIHNLNINNLNINFNFAPPKPQFGIKRSTESVAMKLDSPSLSSTTLQPKNADLALTVAKPDRRHPRLREQVVSPNFRSPFHHQFRSLPHNIASFKRCTANHVSGEENQAVSQRPPPQGLLRSHEKLPKSNRLVENPLPLGHPPKPLLNTKAAKFKKFLQQDHLLDKQKTGTLDKPAPRLSQPPDGLTRQAVIAANSPALNFRKKFRPSLELNAKASPAFNSREHNRIELNCIRFPRSTTKTSRSNSKVGGGIKIVLPQELRLEKRSMDSMNFMLAATQHGGAYSSQTSNIMLNSQSPTDLRRTRNLYNLFDEMSANSAVGYKTFGHGTRLCEYEVQHHLRTNSIQNVSLFNKKRSVPDGKTRLKIEKSIKGLLNRQTAQEELQPELPHHGKEPREDAPALQVRRCRPAAAVFARTETLRFLVLTFFSESGAGL